LARENNVPFYVAAPSSTIDPHCPTGAAIPIEERDQEEVLWMNGQRVSPRGAQAANPAFDVTPARYITGIITENGIFKPAQIKKALA
jgi:methylthioribose-1-phosphate isomerase